MTASALGGHATYEAYLYSYPHKTSYRPLSPAVELGPLWASEKRDALSLYLHVPFCESRCGYCNLFSVPRPKPELVGSYLEALARQARQVRAALGRASFARFALGGGTPTFLEPRALGGLLDLAERTMGTELAKIPSSVEVSPATADRDRLTLLRGRGIGRISIGVQSFVESEVAAVHRSQAAGEARRAIALIRELGFPILNVDLIYGLPGQDGASWRSSLEEALRFAPEEIYLYPLYVRPMTGLGRSSGKWDDVRVQLYRVGRDHLLARGYRQVSMRMFRLASKAEPAGPVYHCQEDGMVGLGTGARSYTSALHYSTPYALAGGRVRGIVESFAASTDAQLATARYGIWLDGEDQRRRFVILSLLADGLDLVEYRRRFSSDARADLQQLGELVEASLAGLQGDRLVLSAEGIERSDAIGPWLRSRKVADLMAAWEPG